MTTRKNPFCHRTGAASRREGKRMRYFKCANPKAVNRETVAQDVCFAEQEKKNDRQGKGLHYAANALFALVSLAAFVGCGFLIAQIPVPKNPFLFILLIAGKLLLGVGALVVSVLFGHLVSSPIAEKAQKKSAARKRQAFEESLTSLREFYGWKEPCVVTKCYESSDKESRCLHLCYRKRASNRRELKIRFFQ